MRGRAQALLLRHRADFERVTLDALAKLVPISQIVYGTDFPYRTAADHTKGVTGHFKGDDLKKVDRENALRLLPRLKSA